MNGLEARARRIIGATCGCALAVLAVPGGALAGDEVLGTVDGVSYLRDTGTLTPPNPVTVDVNCPVGTRPTGGGFQVGASPEDSLYSGYPVDLLAPLDGTPDSWRTVGYSGGQSLQEISAHAVCHGGELRYRREGGKLPEGTPAARTLTARCPDGTHVVGGGAAAGEDGTPAAAQVNSSYPIDGADRDKAPDDGWRGRFYGSEQPRTRVVAICAETKPRYRQFMGTLKAGDAGGVFLDCPAARHVLGIGVRIDGDAAQGHANSTYPGDGFPGRANDDADSLPDDVANTSATNVAGAAKNVTGFGICG